MSSVGDDESETTNAKPVRVRKKKLRAQLLKQFEFYFSDANLRKDQFMQNIIKNDKDGYVPVSIFCTFNRIKSMTTEISTITQAMGKSKFLELSEDKLNVRRKDRKTPGTLSTSEDVDDRTVYVEYLPPEADIEWMRKLFSDAGEVLFVSLPKYQSTGDLKGFGFVEFATVKGAQEACMTLNNPPANALEKIGKFPKASKQMKQLSKKVDTLEKTDTNPNIAIENSPSPKNVVKKSTDDKTDLTENGANAVSKDSIDSSKKRPHSNSPDKATDTSSQKRLKTDELDTSNTSDAKTSILKSADSDQNAKKRLSTVNVKKDDDQVKRVRISDKVQMKEPPTSKGKRRKRTQKDSEKDSKEELPEIRVIPKTQWAELKAEYLAMQKSSMTKLKQKLSLINKQTKAREAKAALAEQTLKASKEIQFTAGVIVKVTTKRPSNRKDVKEKLVGLGEISYIDFMEGSTNGHLRCKNAESALKISDSKHAGMQLALLTGEDEKSYWEKLQADRSNKLNSTKRTKKRGFQKVIERAEKFSAVKKSGQHIIFD